MLRALLRGAGRTRLPCFCAKPFSASTPPPSHTLEQKGKGKKKEESESEAEEEEEEEQSE